MSLSVVCSANSLPIAPDFLAKPKEIGYFRIGLTMVRGHIFVYHDGVKVPASLKVIETKTKHTEELVYSPDTLEGNYFMFLEPSNNYEVWVESDGFQPCLLSLHIPNNTYYYEINHDIHFKSIKLLGDKIGQKVELQNSHYNLVNFQDKNEEDRLQIGYNFMLDFVAYALGSGEERKLEDFQKVEQLMSKPIFDTKSEADLSPDSTYNDLLTSIENIFISGDSKKLTDLTLLHKKYDQKLFYLANAENNATSHTSPIIQKAQNGQIIYRHALIFNTKNKKLSEKQKQQLDEVAVLLNENEELQVEILGHTFRADSLSTRKQFDRTNKHTKKVFRYLKARVNQIEKFALIANGLREDLANFLPNEIDQNALGLSKIELLIIQK